MTTPPRKLWITYAWADNKTQDVDFIAQQLRVAGLDVRLDRWDIATGEPLWPQIERFIQDPKESDAWLFFTTTNSLGSKPCREEYAYALDRALSNRDRDYPIIALVSDTVDGDLLPAGLRVRIYVSLTDPDWIERVVAGAEKRPLNITSPIIKPYYHKVHRISDGYAIEFRPRAGVWYPFVAGLPYSERDKLMPPEFMPGAPNHPPSFDSGAITWCDGDGVVTTSDDLQWWAITAHEQATPTKSYYLFVKELPSRVMFGPEDGTLRWVPLRPPDLYVTGGGLTRP